MKGFGWTLEEVDRQSSIRSDYLIKIHEVVTQVAEERSKEQTQHHPPAATGGSVIRNLHLLEGGNDG